MPPLHRRYVDAPTPCVTQMLEYYLSLRHIRMLLYLRHVDVGNDNDYLVQTITSYSQVCQIELRIATSNSFNKPPPCLMSSPGMLQSPAAFWFIFYSQAKEEMPFLSRVLNFDVSS